MNEENKNIDQLETDTTTTSQTAQAVTPNQEPVTTQVPQANPTVNQQVPVQNQVSQVQAATNSTPVTPQTKEPIHPQASPQTPIPQQTTGQNNQQTTKQVTSGAQTQRTNEPSLLKEQDDEKEQPREKNDAESNKSLILIGIFFVIMFAFIMFLPTINTYVTHLKEKRLEDQIVDPVDENDKKDEQNIPGITNGKEVEVTCTSKESVMIDASSMRIKYTYTHIDDKIKKVKKEIIYTYETSTTESFIEQEKKCDNEIKTNNAQEGYNANCSLEENTITVTESFDLKTFKNFTGTDGSTITPVTELDTSLKEEVEELTNQGYTCE